MWCEELIELMANYGAAVAAYYSSVATLEKGMISGSLEMFAERRRLAEEARTICEAARQALDDYLSKHEGEVIIDARSPAGPEQTPSVGVSRFK